MNTKKVAFIDSSQELIDRIKDLLKTKKHENIEAIYLHNPSKETILANIAKEVFVMIDPQLEQMAVECCNDVGAKYALRCPEKFDDEPEEERLMVLHFTALDMVSDPVYNYLPTKIEREQMEENERGEFFNACLKLAKKDPIRLEECDLTALIYGLTTYLSATENEQLWNTLSERLQEVILEASDEDEKNFILNWLN